MKQPVTAFHCSATGRCTAMLGIAEKLPKSPMKLPKVASPRISARRPIVALEGRAGRKRH